MCGIAAILGTQKSADRLESMLRMIAHRGEDRHFNESAEFENCVLGMNRLAIVDRDHARQPISSGNGRYHVILNGEIYNHQSIRQELEALGFSFETSSDTEVVVNAYAAWGVSCLEKFSGMYAFIIYDTQEKDIFAARDPFGVKPLYFLQEGNGTAYFASEIKALCDIGGREEEIKLFPPGHYMISGELHRYFHLPTHIERDVSDEDAVEKIRFLFDHSVKIRVQTDLPVAVYFSGGVDSAAVLEAARRFHPDVTAIIAGNDRSQDRQVAVRYCEENDIKYAIGVPPDEDELFALAPEIVRITESFEPNMIRQSAVSYYIAKTAADLGFKIILCGEGSDEIFAGYPEFLGLRSGDVERRTLEFLSDLHRTQLQRVDRTSMFYTTEVREPFLDKDLVSYVASLPGGMKIDPKLKISKLILRKAMAGRLPDYISQRKKVVLSEGAGFKGNDKMSGLFYTLAAEKISDTVLKEYKKNYKDWRLSTKEDVYYFQLFQSFGYARALFNRTRTSVNKSSTLLKDEIQAQKILAAFNSWSFKRCQPKHPEKMHSLILSCVQNNEPVPFVMYWGKGSRHLPNEREGRAFAYLNEMLSRIRAEYSPGASATLVLTDTHARLNGNTASDMEQYFSEIKKIAEGYENIETVYFSSLCGLDEEALARKSSVSPLNPEIAQKLQSSARRHSRKYSPEQSAAMYYWQNQIEKETIASSFSGHIFVTYNGNDMNFLFPEDMPIFYMYAMGKGHGEKPWYF